MEFKNLSIKSYFSLRRSRECRLFCGWYWMFSNAEETASCRGIFLCSVKWEKSYLLRWSSDWEPPSWMMFAWRKVKEKHGASWAVVVTPYLTKSFSCLKPWIRNLWLARKTQWFFFLGLSLFCDLSWNAVGKIGTNKIVSINFLFFFFLLSPKLRLPGEGNGNPLQYSCLENLRDRGPGGLLSMGSHRVGHDWSDLAAAAASLDWRPI